MTPLGALLALATVAAPAAPPTPQQARDFVAKVNADLFRLNVHFSTADWVKQTYITDDTNQLTAWANEDLMSYTSQAIKDSLRFKDVPGLDPATTRSLYLLRVSPTLPAPADAKKREELAALASRMSSIYGKGKWCGKDGKGTCRDLDQLSELMRTSRKDSELLDAWVGWHTIAVEMKPLYERQTELANEGAREIGFANLGDLWRAGYDMSSADFEAETDRLWQEVKPLYDDLHCYVRARLQQTYGKEKVPDGKPIPAHLLGNMWAQEWENIYPLVEPYRGQASLDLTAAMKKQKYDPMKLMKLGEAFFISLGMDPLPKTFWERSMFVKPKDREVVCHPSAWDVAYDNDLRIKICLNVNEEDLYTVHHELGHDYYFHSYYKLPLLFQAGANDGFHEAIGDALTLSITPAYLKQLGLVGDVPTTEKALIDIQLKDALEKIAFLPFSKLVDQWRWDVFSGKVTPDHYNEAWWALRRKYQGVDAPVARSEHDFDPGAKYHVSAGVPYTRYFLARLLQFQFHRAMCKLAGFNGPLHECSIYGNKVAGKKLGEMLSLGASKPWPDALEVLTGQRKVDPSAMLDYFAPLAAWLKEQNKGRACGW
jgi:peptidyl-dipeptidase A